MPDTPDCGLILITLKIQSGVMTTRGTREIDVCVFVCRCVCFGVVKLGGHNIHNKDAGGLVRYHCRLVVLYNCWRLPCNW